MNYWNQAQAFTYPPCEIVCTACAQKRERYSSDLLEPIEREDLDNAFRASGDVACSGMCGRLWVNDEIGFAYPCDC